MFGLFVLLDGSPGCDRTRRESERMDSRGAPDATFAIGALALFATEARSRAPQRVANDCGDRQNLDGDRSRLLWHSAPHPPEHTPGVPSPVLTLPWVPLPLLLAYATGALLIAFGVMMFMHRYASTGAALSWCAHAVAYPRALRPSVLPRRQRSKRVTAINFIFDTLLFAGHDAVISKAIFGHGDAA
jgi:hypothetical protein